MVVLDAGIQNPWWTGNQISKLSNLLDSMGAMEKKTRKGRWKRLVGRQHNQVGGEGLAEKVLEKEKN